MDRFENEGYRPEVLVHPSEIERLQKQIAEARAEIERLKGELIRQIQPEEYVLSTYSTTSEPVKNAKDALIEQMREALVAAKNDGKMRSAITYQLIIAALSAAERGEG